MINRRTAGAALLVYGVATFVANTLIAAPGGDYEPRVVARFVDSGHFPVAFAAAYLGCFGALAILPFVMGIRGELGPLSDLAWGLGVGAATAGVIGWFVSAGVDVAMAEGGSTVPAGVPDPAVYTITEIGNLFSGCAPALFFGVVSSSPPWPGCAASSRPSSSRSSCTCCGSWSSAPPWSRVVRRPPGCLKSRSCEAQLDDTTSPTTGSPRSAG